MKNNQSGKVLFIAQAAMIAAIYVVLTLIGASFSYGEVQVRISEALTILPAFTPAAIPGVFLGCLISNILGGCILPDIIFGSLATLIGAIFTWMLRNKSKYLAPLPPIIANADRRTVCAEIRLHGAASDSVYDADCGNRRSDLLRRARTDPVHSTEQIQRVIIQNNRITVLIKQYLKSFPFADNSASGKLFT